LEKQHLIDSVLNTRLELIKYVKESDYDLFLELAGQNIVLAQKHKKNWALVDIYMEMGEVLVIKGIYNGALDHLNKAMNLAESDEYKPYKGWINVAIGNAYNNMGNYNKCLQFYQSAFEIFKETGNTDGIGLAATNLANSYSLLNDPEKAEYYFKIGLEYREKLGNIVELGFTRMYYYDFKIKQGNYSEAESDLQALLNDLEKKSGLIANNFQVHEAKILQAEIYSLFSVCENHKGNVKDEFLYLQKALSTYKSIHDDLHLATIYNRIGKRYLQTGNYTKALQLADSAILFSKKSVVLTEQAHALNLKSGIYSRLKNPQAALDSYKAFKTISDSIYNRSVIQAISNVDVLTKTLEKEKNISILSLKLEQDRKLRFVIILVGIVFILLILLYVIMLLGRFKKEKQIGVMLKEKNRQISEQAASLQFLNQQLVQLNKSKDRFHSIIAHDLKSPIAAFYSIFDMLYQSYDQLSEEDRKSFIDMAYGEVQRILKLLDNLLTWSRIQGGNLTVNKSDFFIDEAIHEIVDSIRGMAELKDISFFIGHLDHLLIHADKEMIMTVIRNFCTNAIKFTPNGKKIQIGINASDSALEVWILDNGIGIPKDKLDVLFNIDSQVQSKGTNNEPGTGLGLQLCYEFIKMHDGKISVESVVGEGSRFAFDIPVQPKHSAPAGYQPPKTGQFDN
jgi:signal transduction histidine kinase